MSLPLPPNTCHQPTIGANRPQLELRTRQRIRRPSDSVALHRHPCALTGQITPQGKAGRVAAILRAGGYALRFQALEAGRGSVSWYLVPKGAHVTKIKPVLIATRSVSFTAAGTMTLELRLTTAGGRRLKSAGRASLTGKGVFTPTGQPALSALRTFTLKC